MAFLDYSGLSHFLDKIKALFPVKADAIKNITRSGTTFTATRADDTTFTFTQQDSDTKNTAGTTNKTGTKMFIAAATEQSANPVTYSNSNVYIGTDNCLYSGGVKVLTSHQDISGKVSGPSSATNNAVAIFDGTGGKKIKNSGFTIGTSVPSDAVFTDHLYTAGVGLSKTGGTFAVKLGYESVGKNYRVQADGSGDLYVAVPWENTTYSAATQSVQGLMSAADKTKLDGVATGATANVVSNSLTDSSTTNALSAAQGKALSEQIGNKQDKITWANYDPTNMFEKAVHDAIEALSAEENKTASLLTINGFHFIAMIQRSDPIRSGLWMDADGTIKMLFSTSSGASYQKKVFG